MPNDWAELARKAKTGDIDAFTELVDTFKGPLCAVIHPIVRDWHMTQDVAQETFAVAYEHISRLKNPARFRGWLYRIARNRAVSRLRRKTGFHPRSLEGLEEEQILGFPRRGCGISTGEDYGQPSAAALARVRRAVLALPNGYGSILLMRYVQGLSVREIAQAMGRSPRSVKGLLYRSRQLARDYLEKAGLDMERVLHEM